MPRYKIFVFESVILIKGIVSQRKKLQICCVFKNTKTSKNVTPKAIVGGFHPPHQKT